MKCASCQKQLTEIQRGFSLESAFGGVPREFYCKNKECERVGIVVVIGIVEKEDKKEKK